MKRLYLILLICLLALTTQAQELTVKSMTVAGNDISASQYRVNDLNGQPCALVKVQLATRGAKFAGSVIGTPEFKNGVYWVYMPAGVKELEVQHDNFVPCHVTFGDYGIQPLQSLTTYVLTLLMPQGGTAEPVKLQKLTINYSPANAMVLIDSQPYQGNGRLELELPIGNHDYQVVAMGYIANSGSVNLTSSAPRTITETLTKAEPVQQSTVQQSTVQQSDNVQSAAATQSTSSTLSAVPSSASVSGAAVETFTVNGVSFNMVRVDGGTFTMGATSEQGSDAFDDEKPAHQVTLSTYSIGETEVTQALWKAVMGNNPSKFKDDNLPVEQVSWDDCQTFISKLNEMTGKRFRLPTEAEWEYAARGGSKSHGYKYSGSNKIKDVAWYDSNSRKKTHDVKTKQPNELGLYDMSGNVMEWCQDWYGSYGSDSQTNPTGATSGPDRVNRGGGWYHYASVCRVSFRGYNTPSYRFNYLGLRLAF